MGDLHADVAFYIFVLCVLSSVGHAVHATQEDTTTDPDVLQPLQHLKGQLTKLEQRLEDQNNRLLKQQMTIQELNDRIVKQERTMEQQRCEVAQEKKKSAHRFTKQEKTIHMLNRKYNLLRTWCHPQLQNKPVCIFIFTKLESIPSCLRLLLLLVLLLFP